MKSSLMTLFKFEATIEVSYDYTYGLTGKGSGKFKKVVEYMVEAQNGSEATAKAEEWIRENIVPSFSQAYADDEYLGMPGRWECTVCAARLDKFTVDRLELAWDNTVLLDEWHEK